MSNSRALERYLDDLKPHGSIGLVEKLLGGRSVLLIDVNQVRSVERRVILGRIRGSMKRGGRRRQRVETGGWVVYTFREFEKDEGPRTAINVDIVEIVTDERLLSILRNIRRPEESGGMNVSNTNTTGTSNTGNLCGDDGFIFGEEEDEEIDIDNL